MAKTSVIPLDLNFQGRKQAIAAYGIPHADGIVLVECGPASTLPGLRSALATLGYSLHDVTHVLVTHIHLDHAGASGHLAREGAQVIVHPAGAPHLENPEKLLASAARIYGEAMDTLWGEFLPLPPSNLRIAQDEEEIEVGNLRFICLHTPGHAEHHMAYLFEDVCFSGDVGGVRMPNYPYLRVPMPPPELHLERWHETITRLQRLHFKRIAPTHFGLFDDVEWHLAEVDKNLSEAAGWLERVMPGGYAIEDLRRMFTEWMNEQAQAMGLSEESIATFDLANPLGMSADGLYRYWNKVRMAAS
jgi:glyoxylase-like metal-dependent hydrolase (beta-lactamase superfamily II)